MRKLVWGKTFLRSVKKVIKKHPELREDIESALRLLAEDPFSEPLATHKLRGKLAGSWACSVSYDFRIVFDFISTSKGYADDILLIEIGTHDEVY